MANEEWEQELREQLTAWIHDTWDPDLSVAEWWRHAAEAGWSAPHLPVEHGGRGLPRRAHAVAHAVFAECGVLEPPGGLGILMAAPTILAHGDASQIERFVPPILDGSHKWCQLFSEPGAGSDLAGLSTRAERDGDEWVITGQKVWTSGAQDSDMGMLLARTDPSQPTHAGISWFAFSLDQPGIDIRPLREMTGRAIFNEVFLDGAVCHDRDLIGGQGNGWNVARSTLLFERTGIGVGGGYSGHPVPGSIFGNLTRRAGDAAVDEPPPGTVVVSLKFRALLELAREVERTRDPLVRQDLARLWSYERIGSWTAQRIREDAARGVSSAGVNIGKLAQSRLIKASAAFGLDLLGPAGMLWGEQAPAAGVFAEAMVFSPASSIYGGTDQIQRNIAAERSLGLPRA
ncbi:MAG TPA: acyl-CoA dehydrogenase family protein [Acidimicrobiales bacterium]|nr:acyl-CoA dehydrogenase family protein [Acidimicrobiales bacterium]